MHRSLIPLTLLTLVPLASSAAARPAEPPAVQTVLTPVQEEVEAFLADAEARLLEHMVRKERAAWVLDNFITPDTEVMAAEAAQGFMAFISEVVPASRKYDGTEVTPVQRRKLDLLRTWMDLPAPRDPGRRAELAAITARMQSTYGAGSYCPPHLEGRCLDLDQLSEILATSRDWDELLDAWMGWREVSVPMREDYTRFVQLANQGARELGAADVGEIWRSRYDMPPEKLVAEVDRLWAQVKPLYQDLHAYTRAQLVKTYGADKVPERGLIPAHLLGNMWAQDWSALYPMLAPVVATPLDLDGAIEARNWTGQAMVKQGEGFFRSLGFEPLPETFWERSLFVKPADREVVCHASAWDVDFDQDVRIKMCIRSDFDSFQTIHHELGHIYYYLAVRGYSPLLRRDAMDAFNEAIGDTIALSITPTYLGKIAVLGEVPEEGVDQLLRRALDDVAFLPFSVVVDRWRWDVFAGGVQPQSFNTRWWDLVRAYQGVAPPVTRTEEAFDPGAKYHVPANVPYLRYFLSTLLQYQFHRALCREAGYRGPIYQCSIHGNEQAGKKLQAMMALGATRPWPEALKALSGETRIDASALLEYYAPLRRWLRQQNNRNPIGW
ncbi:MAG: M2 family metallopeptidase [Deltaproteobacteria bacterium]|nr:M2 family metallopeptidase [Deltaproteobacteria bacterium]